MLIDHDVATGRRLFQLPTTLSDLLKKIASSGTQKGFVQVLMVWAPLTIGLTIHTYTHSRMWQIRISRSRLNAASHSGPDRIMRFAAGSWILGENDIVFSSSQNIVICRTGSLISNQELK